MHGIQTALAVDSEPLLFSDQDDIATSHWKNFKRLNRTAYGYATTSGQTEMQNRRCLVAGIELKTEIHIPL